jgi:hypothetical protein
MMNLLRQLLLALVLALIACTILVLILATYSSLDFDGHCGFLSDPCAFGQYFADNVFWAVPWLYVFGPFMVLGAITTVVLTRDRVPLKWLIGTWTLVASGVILIVAMLK